jgi:hypothetical protein
MTRRGNWERDPTCGWRLNGTGIVLDFDRLDHSGFLPGAWVVETGPRAHEAIDHYLDEAMAYVEAHKEEYMSGVDDA